MDFQKLLLNIETFFWGGGGWDCCLNIGGSGLGLEALVGGSE